MPNGRRVIVGIGLLFALSSPPAWAALGGSPGGVEVDGQPSSTPEKLVPSGAYIVHERATPDVVVREYATPQGQVFAVFWLGRRNPDLPVLLGRYFEQYQAAVTNREKKRSPMRGMTHIETAELIVETGGPMGAVWGKAYVPAQFPPGMTKEAIQ